MRNDYKELRRHTAKKRQENRNSLRPDEQLAVLDRRLGKNVGATKERKKLNEQLNKNSNNELKNKEKDTRKKKEKKGH